MYTSDNEIRKMFIQVDIDKISDEAAKKLNKILAHCKMELTEDSWYTGTNAHCQVMIAVIPDHKDVFDCITKWIFWDPKTNIKEDVVKEYHDYKRKWEAAT